MMLILRIIFHRVSVEIRNRNAILRACLIRCQNTLLLCRMKGVMRIIAYDVISEYISKIFVCRKIRIYVKICVAASRLIDSLCDEMFKQLFRICPQLVHNILV